MTDKINFVPKFIRMHDAPSYLGMDKHRFNREVRPYVIAIKIGKQGVAFDRENLDAWAKQYAKQHCISAPKPSAEIMFNVVVNHLKQKRK